MPKFRITYHSSFYEERARTEDVEADRYDDEGEWITFTRRVGAETTADPQREEQVLRVQGSTVRRIEIVQ